MEKVRISTREDISTQRALWKLAFGDSDGYIDNFYQHYYRPERMLVLEREGRVLSMTAWFDTELVLPGGESFRAAYLYAVATHPDHRGEGLAGQLLAGADDCFRTWGIPAVTTVPAQPSLHRFFGANGFRECFVHASCRLEQAGEAEGEPLELERVTAAQYGELREQLLAGQAHIRFPEDALVYQENCCQLSGGGLYAAQTAHGPALLCAEGMEDGQLFGKEVLGGSRAREQLLSALPRQLPAFSGRYRVPGGTEQFGMLKWLDREREKDWNWSDTAYLGLAFD